MYFLFCLLKCISVLRPQTQPQNQIYYSFFCMSTSSSSSSNFKCWVWNLNQFETHTRVDHYYVCYLTTVCLGKRIGVNFSSIRYNDYRQTKTHSMLYFSCTTPLLMCRHFTLSRRCNGVLHAWQQRDNELHSLSLTQTQ